MRPGRDRRALLTSLPAPPLLCSGAGSRSCRQPHGPWEGRAGHAGISVLVELEEVKLGMGPLPCLKRVSKPRPETLAARPFERSV